MDSYSDIYNNQCELCQCKKVGLETQDISSAKLCEKEKKTGNIQILSGREKI